jgi:hypothetical protein
VSQCGRIMIVRDHLVYEAIITVIDDVVRYDPKKLP